MGMADPLAGDQDWNEKLKYLSDDDLMDIWAETQALETALNSHMPGHDFPGASFERVIIHELTMRAEQRGNVTPKKAF